MEHKIFRFTNGEFLNLRRSTFGNKSFEYGFNVTDDLTKATYFDGEEEPLILRYLDGRLVTLRMEVIDHE